MKAHKVPATYYASWKIPGKNHSFYVFYKDKLYNEGQSKSYKEVDKITQEHSFFMEENLYYLDIKNVPGLTYKLQNEIEEFLTNGAYSIKCQDTLDEDCAPDYPVIEIRDYSQFMYWRDRMDSWIIKDSDGNNVTVDAFKNDLGTYLFGKVGKIIEENYFANELEPKWNVIKSEIEIQRNSGDDFALVHQDDLLEFFIVQYLRLEGVIEEYIKPTLGIFRDVFSSMGCEDSELDKMKNEGLLAPESYFYGALLDAARGDKKRLQKHMDSIKQNYVIDLLKAEEGISFITSTKPCVVMKMEGTFKAEMIFPVTPQYCIRFIGNKLAGNRSGKFYEITSSDVKVINRKIISESRNIVMSESKIISDRI